MFRFGRNWRHFNAGYFNAERLALAKKSILDFLGVQTLHGKTFVDVGAGSGIDSLAAYELGAVSVLSFDPDSDCVVCCRELRANAGNPDNWQVGHGSILDMLYVSTLGQYDIVYAWGVLHHTGQMWKAIEHTMMLVKPGGVLYLAIYNKADGLAIYPDLRFGPSSFWQWEKKIYVRLPAVLQHAIDYTVMSVLVLCYLLTLHNPVKIIRGHKQYFNKGMPWRINIKDWLGGYPYEYATVAEVFRFARKRGFTLENLTCNNGLLNNEFLLKKV